MPTPVRFLGGSLRFQRGIGITHNLKVVGSNPTPAPTLRHSKARPERKFRAGLLFLAKPFGTVSHVAARAKIGHFLDTQDYLASRSRISVTANRGVQAARIGPPRRLSSSRHPGPHVLAAIRWIRAKTSFVKRASADHPDHRARRLQSLGCDVDTSAVDLIAPG